MAKEQNEILLQSGTNEIEVFEFMIENRRYGINALKVSQATLFEPHQIQVLPMMPHGMMGTILSRDQIIKVIDLRKALGMASMSQVKRPILLFCEFNGLVLGFVVDEIAGIQRVSWENVHSPSPILKTSSITGVAIVGDREVSMLDLESIVSAIFGLDEVVESEKAAEARQDFHVLVADDSASIRKKISWLMNKKGIVNAEYFENGAQLVQRFEELHSSGQMVSLVVTDLEMPQLDGFACCKRMKALSPQVPVAIFSSLINEQIARKCQAVGADFSLNKEEFTKLEQVLEELMSSRKVA